LLKIYWENKNKKRGNFVMLFHDWLKDSSKVILFDGGMGTEIIKRGIEPGKIPDILNIEQPNIIEEIFRAYYEAGSDMCQTNTFGSSYLSLKRYNLEGRIKEIIEKAIDNIRKACPPDHLIVGDIGPSGEYKPPVGKITIEQWYSGFLKQVEYLENGVDLWHAETISDIDEMVAALKAIREISKKPIISSMTYKKTKRGFFTYMGDSLEKCVTIQENENVEVIGANCTLGSGDMIELFKEMMEFTDKPISIKPNAGQPRVEPSGKTAYDQPVKSFADDIGQVIKLGAKVVGGCCGTSPKTIEEIKKIIDSL